MKNILIWKKIALVSGAFVFIISMLLIVNYIQYKRIDPVDTVLINNLVERLNQNPQDEQLRNEIRALDLLARKAYFTNQWQVRTGGYLLLLGIAVLIIAMQVIKSNTKLKPEIGGNPNSFYEKKTARKYIAYGGTFIVVTALVFAFLTHNELSLAVENASLSDSLQNTESEKASLSEKEEEKEVIAENIDNTEDTESKTDTISDVELAEKEPVKNDISDNTKPEDEIEKSQVENVKEIVKEATPEKKLAEFPTWEEIKKNQPTFRGAGGNGISYHKNIPVHWNTTIGTNVIWKTEIPLHGYNSPVIWDNKIFITGANSEKREVYCIDRNTGKILWTYNVVNVPGSPAKSPKTTEDTGQAAPTVATDGRRVYAIFANSDIVALDMEGKLLWSRNLGPTGNHYGHSSSLMLYQKVLIVQYDVKKNPKIMGLSVSTGKTIWETPRKVKVSWASPVVVNTGNQTEVIVAADPIVASFNPLTGKENWKIDCIGGEVGPSVCYSDGIVFSVNDYSKLAAIKIGEKPEIIWENDELLSDVPSPVATKDLLFMPTSYGVVVCYDTKTGEKYWEQEFDNGFYSSPMLVEGKIYLMDMSGDMQIFSASKTFKLIATSSIGEKGMTTPAFTDGKIYIRGNKHLFCIGK